MTAETRVCVGPGLESVAQACADLLREATGLPLPLTQDAGATQGLHLSLAPDIEAEGYRLHVTPESVTLEGADEAGLWYGAQTLRQLLRGEGAATLPCLRIEDAPRFRWRGLHLDVGRHLYPLEFCARRWT